MLDMIRSETIFLETVRISTMYIKHKHPKLAASAWKIDDPKMFFFGVYVVNMGSF